MNQVQLLTSPHILEELLVTLRSQGLMPSSLRLIGLLGVGNNATVFSATIDGVYHIVKVYASRERMSRELKHLRRVTPPERQVLVMDDHVDGFDFHFFIVEMPAGHQLLSEDLTPGRIQSLSDQLVWLHRVKFKQRVPVEALRSRLKQASIALEHVEELGLERAKFETLFDNLSQLLTDHASAFAVPRSRIHGDLWWPNVVATPTDAYLIDWDEMRRADPAEDLARLRTELWFSKNAFPSRNFFWSAPDHGDRVGALMSQIVTDHETELGGDVAMRLRFYLPLAGLYQIAKLAIGGSITEPILRPSLYRLMAEDVLRLAADPTAPPPDLTGTEYYAMVVRSRTERLDGLLPAPDQLA